MNTKRFMKWLAPVLTLAVLGAGTVARGGARYTSAFCVRNADASGHCYGSLVAFRNHENGATSAEFSVSSDGAMLFKAEFAPTATAPVTSMSCTPNAKVAAFWDKALSHHGYFNIYWDAAGTCYHLYLANGSRYF
ncbi:hypothetical protein ACN28E_29320 [Archangium lansingense]|uniref:hypothetical protein n=1 Tax=Archangium lansingense TaxID=2995310 RepID=UPI003B82A33B